MSERQPKQPSAGPRAAATADPARRRLLGAAGAAGVITAAPAIVRAQAWPSKPIRIVLPFPAGGLTDNYGRQYGEFLSRKLGQPVVVDNRPGASGTIGVDAVCKAPADGYTLLVTTLSSVWQSRVLYRSLPFNADRDLTPITLFHSGALAMGVNAKLPIKTPKDYVEMARKKPVNMGSYAPSSWPHLIADTWNRNENLNLQSVHYKGETPMWVDIATGQIEAGVGSFQAMRPHIERGTVRPIAVVGNQRSPTLPNVPTFAEQGFKDPIFTLEGWLPMCAPAGTPPEIVQRISEAILEAYTTPKIKALHESFGIPIGPTGIEEARRRWKEESPIWIALAHRLGITLG